jgi:hypothetical protein
LAQETYRYLKTTGRVSEQLREIEIWFGRIAAPSIRYARSGRLGRGSLGDATDEEQASNLSHAIRK